MLPLLRRFQSVLESTSIECRRSRITLGLSYLLIIYEVEVVTVVKKRRENIY